MWFLKVVEDEIVAATHGRGIWSVQIPELEQGRTFNPLLEQVAQRPDGVLSADFMLRSAYDSSEVYVDGVVVQSFGTNVARATDGIDVPVMTAGLKDVFVRGYKDGQTYDSITRTVDAQVFDPPVAQYVAPITDGSDFALSGLSIGTTSGFTGTGLQTPHPYQDGSSDTALLTQPIRVLPTSRLLYDEVAIIEPGEPGAGFGEFGFWDYAVVEATTDGTTWTPLFDGYDANDDPVWRAAYDNNASIDESMLRTREVDLGALFPANTDILVRFRFFSDGFVTGWGWWVDNVRVEADVTNAPSSARLALDQNVPNPFNPNTTIGFSLPRQTSVKLQIFDVRGRLVRTLVDETRGAGEHRVVWDGTDQSGRTAASGVYLYRMAADGQVMQNKMTLVK